ncbi:hypothetical protein Sjap_008383 [Stephania japonica]|uniref:Uncharacterized protein n=1 Tax=Stephania japonica TaxID=461633 RepID=A0AAP0JPU7_9MAGN
MRAHAIEISPIVVTPITQRQSDQSTLKDTSTKATTADVAERDWRRVEAVTWPEGPGDTCRFVIGWSWKLRLAGPVAERHVAVQNSDQFARLLAKIWETAQARIPRKIDELDLKRTCACPRGRCWLDEKMLTVLDCLRGLLSLAESAVCDATRPIRY